MFGREPNRFMEFDDKEYIEWNPQIYEKDYTKNIQSAWKTANILLQNYRNEMIQSRKKELGKRKIINFKIGEKVWIKAPSNSLIEGNSTKLTSRSIGPYEIVEILKDNNIKLQISPSITEVFRPHQLILLQSLQNIKR